MYNSNCLCKLCFDLQQNKQGKTDFFINHQKKLLSLKPNPLSRSFYDTTLGLFGLDWYVLLIQGGDDFEQGVRQGCEG